MSQTGRTFRGFTARSVAVSVLLMLLLALIIQFAGVTESWGMLFGTEALPVPALMLFCGMALVSGGVYAATRFRVLTQAEMVVVLAAVLISAPLMAHGFWRYMLALPGGIVRKGSFEYYDSFNKNLWPHGPNLLRDLGRGDAAGMQTNGAVTLRMITNAAGRCIAEVALRNDMPGATCFFSVRLPVARKGGAGVQPGAPYLLTMLARPARLDGEAMYYCHMYHDGNRRTTREIFASRKAGKRTAVQPEEFTRVGVYGVRAAERAHAEIAVEFGLHGQGEVVLREMELMDVSALENAYLGRVAVAAQDSSQVPESEREQLLVEPRTWWSVAGLRYLVTGYCPWQQWLRPLGAWSAYIALLLTGLFAAAAIMRRQWLDNERYPLPLAQVPLALLGDGRDTHHALAAIWRNRLMWAGFAATLVWCLLGVWRHYNPQAPSIGINIAIKPYLEGPAWGKTWDGVVLNASPLIFGLALFMELNVLVSLVVGYLLFRLQYWFGNIYGLAADNEFPYVEQQRIGAVLAYGALALVFTRKYLWQVLRQALRGENETGEVFAPREALLLLGAVLLGIAVWARWIGMDARAHLLFFLFVLLTGFVAMKLRAECGTPHAGAFFAGGIYIVPLLGGLRLLGADSVVFMTLASGVLFSHCFFHVPGMQLELIEIGRREHLARRHVAWACALGVAGAVVIGGWVYFSSMYAIGAQNYPVMTGEFTSLGNFKVFLDELSKATDAQCAGAGGTGAAMVIERTWWGFGYAGLLTIIVVCLRQVFAGFWFHPIGILLGSTEMMREAWGSILLAWGVRAVVLKLGGAATVRNKLLPVATGIVLGVVAAYALFALLKYYLYFFHPSDLRFYLRF